MTTNDNKPRKQRVPAGLASGGHGQRLWNDLTERVEFTDIELRYLENACFTLDRIAKMRKAIGNELLVKGSQGQKVAHPLLRELRADERHFADLMARIDLPDEFAQEQPQSQGERSAQMRAVVGSRWGNAY